VLFAVRVPYNYPNLKHLLTTMHTQTEHADSEDYNALARTEQSRSNQHPAGAVLNAMRMCMCFPACSRSIIMSARVLAEAAAVMVVDHKGRILHATAKLAQMLGVPVAKMTKMELSALLPQPVTQMHGAWFKVLLVEAAISAH
jgi:hypothetical protein